MASIDITGGDKAATAARRAAQQAVTVEDPMVQSVKPVFLMFLQQYRLPSSGSSTALPAADELPLYVQAAHQLEMAQSTTLYVDYTHVAHYQPQLCNTIREHFYRLAPHLNAVVQQFMLEFAPQHDKHIQGLQSIAETSPFRVAFYHLPVISTIRDLKTGKIGELMSISGTVTRTSAVRPELRLATFRCGDCKTINANIAQQFRYSEPNRCLNATCENRQRWLLDTSLSEFSDWQLVRIQENSSEIPAGSMPRAMKIVLRHDIVEMAKPGDKCVFTGTLIVVPDVAQLGGGGAANARFKAAGGGGGGRRNGGAGDAGGAGGVGGLKELGVRDLTYSLCFLAHSVRTSHSAFGSIGGASSASDSAKQLSQMQLQGGNGGGDAADSSAEETEESFSEAERDRIEEMKRQGKLYTRLVASIAPNIFGHDEIKRGILLMLFGGVHKKTADGQNLRGDINVCIVGDPSTSKSQFLKYVCTFLPRAVYTSGKASSAAGLTASIARDVETGEFAIEAGALMLADNGICCIDEFDKMDPADQVAIHEAMEQQTISIAKAGIQATLNARTSILAAANPIKGRYDPSRTLKQNVDISAPIMSRFDLFFVVLDQGDQAIDYNIARHIVNVHTGKASYNRPEFSLEDLQLYIRYARTRKPAISEEARQFFVDNYCSLRGADSTGTNKSAYRITVRQLESMIRLAEARARLDLSDLVTPLHVKEAARLLKKSIVHVESRDVELEDEDDAVFADEDDGNVDMTNGDDAPRGDDDDEDEQGGGGRGGMDDDQKSHASARSNGTASKPKRTPSASEGKEAEATADGEAAPARPVEKLSFSEYQRITLLLVHYMRVKESKGEPSTSWSELVNYFVAENVAGNAAAAGEAGAVQSEADLAARTRRVELVIHRLIKTDHILLLLQKSKDKSKRMLQVHPNFTGDADALAADDRARVVRAEEAETAGSLDQDLMADTKVATARLERLSRAAVAGEAEEEEEKEPRRASAEQTQPMEDGNASEAAPRTPASNGRAKKAAAAAHTPVRSGSKGASSQGSGRSARSRK